MYPYSSRGSPAEPAPSSRRGRGCSRGAQSTEVDGSSNVVEDNRQHLRPSGREELHDFERDDNVSQSEDGESSSEGRLSSDDDEEVPRTTIQSAVDVEVDSAGWSFASLVLVEGTFSFF